MPTLAERLAILTELQKPTRNYSPGQRHDMWERDGKQCGICGEAVAFEDMDLDHIVRSLQGGSDALDNLRVTHVRCNRSRARIYPRESKPCETCGVNIPNALTRQRYCSSRCTVKAWRQRKAAHTPTPPVSEEE
jgi:formamidopyrimidine-DNA glycosylase